MPTIFTKIINGDVPCYKIAEDGRFFSFLDINPLSEGHTLVIPKIEEDYIFDLDPELLGDMFKFAQSVAIKLRKSIPCNRVAIVVIGLDVPHAHIHLIPMNTLHDVDFSKEKLKLSKERFEEIRLMISEAK